jgi:hypothetical protein
MTKEKKSSEIDLVIKMTEKMTPDEIVEYSKAKFHEDLGILKRLINEQKQATDEVRNTPNIQPLLIKVSSLYKDLIADGYLKKDLFMFDRGQLDEYKTGQARQEVSCLLNELVGRSEKDYKSVFRKMNRVYAINYETIIKTYLADLALKLSGKKNLEKGDILEKLSKYKNGKHAEVFQSLIPQIRNSIQHADYIIDPKKPQITFFDRNKPPLPYTLEEYSKLLWEPWLLSIAFDIATFDIVKDFYDYLIEQIDIVDDFVRKKGCKLVANGEAPFSVLDWATLIKTGKIR